MSNSSNSSIHESSQLNMSTDNDTKLDLPFETTDDINVIQTVNYYFTKMLNIAWLPCDTFEQYLAKIKQYENKYFDIQNLAISRSLVQIRFAGFFFNKIFYKTILKFNSSTQSMKSLVFQSY